MKEVFLDRDGTIIEESAKDETPIQENQMVFLADVIPSLKKIISMGYQLIMVSNQPGLGVTFSKEEFGKAQEKLLQVLKENDIVFQEIFICPHQKELNCNCRKPKTGLLDNFLKTHEIDLRSSFVIGDRESDMELAHNIGCKGILLSNTTNNKVDYTFPSWIEICSFLKSKN